MFDIFLLKKIIFYISLLALIYCMSIKMDPILVLPFLWMILYRFFLPKNLITGGGFLIMTLVSCIRYLVYPILYLTDNSSSGGTIMHQIAIGLMCVEMIAIFVTIKLYYRNKKLAEITKIGDARVNSIVPLTLTLFVLLLVATGQDVLGIRSFIWNYEDTLGVEIETKSHVGEKVFEWFLNFSIIFLLNSIYRKYNNFHKSKYFILTASLLFGCCLYSGGNSRLSIMIPGITACSMLYKLYGKKANGLIYIGGASLAGVLFILSLLKMFRGEAADVNNTSGLFTESSINSYFAGVNNVVTGLKCYAVNGWSLSHLWADLGKNTMGISSYFHGYMSSLESFNYTYYMSTIANDQICPTIINGFLYFGPLFFYIPTMIMVYFVCYSDYKWASVSEIPSSYLYASVPIIIGFALPGSFNHFIINFFNVYIPMLLLIKINKKL